MRTTMLLLGAIFGGIIGGALAQAVASNQPGVVASGTWTQGGCVAIGAPLNGNTFALVPATCPSPPALAIGTTVGGSPSTNTALMVDVNGKLAQFNALSAQ